MKSGTSDSTQPFKRGASVPPGATWLCYILRCADDTLYTGITNDLEKRLAAHDAGTAARYTRGRGPVKLVFVEGCADKSAALKREMKIKGLPRADKLALIGSAAG
ncbi:MAG: GIY-YIG nuclease family protein [Gallionella sp.]